MIFLQFLLGWTSAMASHLSTVMAFFLHHYRLLESTLESYILPFAARERFLFCCEDHIVRFLWQFEIGVRCCLLVLI
jgi:hypothetical protein